MFARVHTLETGPEEYARGVELVRDVLLPWARESTGFCGLIGLVDEAREESLVITLWSDAGAAEASAAAGDRLGSQAALASGARRSSLRDYAVTIFDVPAGAGAQRAGAAASAAPGPPGPERPPAAAV